MYRLGRVTEINDLNQMELPRAGNISERLRGGLLGSALSWRAMPWERSSLYPYRPSECDGIDSSAGFTGMYRLGRVTEMNGLVSMLNRAARWC